MPRVDSPFEILEWVNNKAFKVDLPRDYGVSTWHIWAHIVWNFLREFDRFPRRLRQNQLNHYKEQLNYLSIFTSTINLINLKTLRDQIALLEKNFEYTIWYQPYKQIDES